MPDAKSMITTLRKHAAKGGKPCAVEEFLKKSASKFDDPMIDVFAGFARLEKLVASEKKKAGSDKARKKQLEALEREMAAFEAERTDIPDNSSLP